jgi:hypothetical protein
MIEHTDLGNANELTVPGKEGVPMAEPIPVGSDVSSGTYRCTSCGYELGVQSIQSLPPCPKCDGPYSWKALSGGDAADDPYPQDA